VLVKELEGLALGVEILSEDERQIVLSEKTSRDPLDLGISLEREELGEGLGRMIISNHGCKLHPPLTLAPPLEGEGVLSQL